MHHWSCVQAPMHQHPIPPVTRREMQQDILIIGVLFPAIPLMMINFGNRYTVLASLIRDLHDAVIRDNTSLGDAERFLRQINTLRKRLRLIGIVQTISALAFCFALSAMIATYLDAHDVGSWLFFGSIILMVLAMLGFTIEIQIANSALDVHISDLEDHHEWHHLITPKRRRRAAKSSVQQAPRTMTARPAAPLDCGAESRTDGRSSPASSAHVGVFCRSCQRLFWQAPPRYRSVPAAPISTAPPRQSQPQARR